MDNLTIPIGTPSQGIRITVWRRTHAGCTDYWDGNWLSATVDVAVGRFRGRVDGDVRADEFVAFQQQIRRLYESLSGQAEFRTMEEWIGVRMEPERTGHIGCEGFVIDQPGIGNRLAFTLKLDQTYLPEIMRAVDAVIKAFPVIGAP